MIDPFGAVHAQCYSKAEVEKARQEGRDEVLKLAAKIVAKLELAMTPDFATQLEQASSNRRGECSGSQEGLNEFCNSSERAVRHDLRKD